MSDVQHLSVSQDEDGIRLDRWFKRHYPGLSFGVLSRLLRTGQIRLDGKRAKPGDRIAAGQDIRVPPVGADATQPPRGAGRTPKEGLSDQDIAEVRSWVLYKDDQVIALNKPAGLATQGGPGITRHVDGLLDALRFGKNDERPRLVHRLDKDTSGVLMIARTVRAASELAAAFKGRDAHKVYWALVKGTPSPREGKILAPMEKLPGPGGERMVVTERGKPARTLYAVIENAGQKAAWLALKPLTGRTHQLRLHCAHMEHVIVGDGKYGGSEAFLGGLVSRKLHLHARRLRVPHPDGGVVDVIAPLPNHMDATWETFGWDAEYEDDPFEDAGFL
ncbi:pseudouridine synthase [Iodidimonas gelatinilytica]|uniref:Pseudouridine synthase n=1 Tax=Iodidimonas gelatinilytica TaxID=1236966 RepID=A0A5A7MNV2_9PROT|nr:RluA family pseudouridine synthase [Iodidimonas gelatinilytica]GEQ97314.1 pseudouridine synthase [Iodidimonas gelatinilytica]GEQ99640.1 pseudouridine synthase [Iodidimonas gelatinilytica]